ncbi:hypothetical protein EJ04DRAFT_557794 [Polyplosphaeria fusca]|uniref:Uncharacterized protein n=1 Tax=Polyplosphaeria fusca TaxID=682080 RepID=A0A9P4UU32_9PLEO|nr:hypothetical protein EJ04DRAFT_557794 [Polyplosphaeria fusca]
MPMGVEPLRRVPYPAGESGEVDEVGKADGWVGAPVPTSREDAGAEEPCQEIAHQPVPNEDCNQGTVLAIDSKRSDFDADSDDPYEENAGLQPGDRFEAPNTSTTGSYEDEVAVGSIDTVVSETIDWAETPGLPHRHSTSTPPTSPSIMYIQQSTREHRTEKTLEREAKLLSTGSISSSSSSSSGSDADDNDLGGECTTALIRKRKHFPTTNGTSHKRRSQGLARKARTNPTKRTARRRNSFPSRKMATSSRSSVSRYATGAHFGGDGSSEGSDYQTHNLPKGPKSIVSNRGHIGYSCAQDEELLATHAPPHTTNWTPPVEAQWHLSGTTLHSISAEMSFLTALFRARSGSGILSASHAVKLLENVVGLSMKLDDATIRFLAPDTWVLTSLVGHLPGVAGGGTGQSSFVLPGLRSGRAATTPHLEYGRSSNDVDDEASSDDFDESEEDSRSVVEPSSFRKIAAGLKRRTKVCVGGERKASLRTGPVLNFRTELRPL